MVQVFSKEWFKQNQKTLLWFSNTLWGRYVLRIYGKRSSVGKNKIVKIEPHAIHWIKEIKGDRITFSGEYRTHHKFGKRLYYAFKPFWLLLHFWDLIIANKLNPSWNLGFDTLTAYPEAGSGTAPVDAIVARSGVNESLATIIAGAGTSSPNNSDTYGWVRLDASSTSNQYATLMRQILGFDTSSIDGDIDDATLSLYGLAKGNNLGSISIGIVGATPASESAIVTADYNTLGSTEFASRITYSSFSTSAYNDFTLNSSGEAAIDDTGNTMFGCRSGWDLDGSGVTWSSSQYSRIGFGTADQSGTSSDPKLVVNYTTGIEQQCSETITVSSSVLKTPGKVQSETVSIVDSIVKSATKISTETISIVESLVKSVSKTFTGTFTIVDSIEKTVTKLKELLETITIVETFERGITKVYSETLSIVDSVTKSLNRAISETVSIVESLTKQALKIKILTEVITLVDSITSSIVKMWTKQSKPTTTYTKQSKPTTTYTKQ